MATLGTLQDNDRNSFVEVSDGGTQIARRVSLHVGSIPVLIDEASSSVTYIGKSRTLGVDEGSAVWQIQKIELSGTVTKILWADGDGEFDNVWSDRASLTYSI